MKTLIHTPVATHAIVTSLVPATASRPSAWPSTRSTLLAPCLVDGASVSCPAPASAQGTLGAGPGSLPRPQAAELLYAAASVLLPFLLAAALLLG